MLNDLRRTIMRVLASCALCMIMRMGNNECSPKTGKDFTRKRMYWYKLACNILPHGKWLSRKRIRYTMSSRDTWHDSVCSSTVTPLFRSTPNEHAPNFANDIQYSITTYVRNARCNRGRCTKRNSVSTSIHDQLSRSKPNQRAPNFTNDIW